MYIICIGIGILANLSVWPCTLLLISYIMLLILSLGWNTTTFCHTVDIFLPKYFIRSFNTGAFSLSFGCCCCCWPYYYCSWPVPIRLVTISTFSVHVVFSLYVFYMVKTKNREKLHETHSANLTYTNNLVYWLIFIIVPRAIIALSLRILHTIITFTNMNMSLVCFLFWTNQTILALVAIHYKF